MEISFRVPIKNGVKNDMREGKKEKERERERERHTHTHTQNEKKN